MLYTQNRENRPEYNINSAAWANRRPGVSAFVRLADEEEWVGPAIESILPWVDEVVCTLQCSTDRTEDILRSFDSPKIDIYQYPFKSWPNGPGHGKQPGSSLHNNAYFYNWSLSLTKYEWALKWDGDMVAFDWLGEVAHKAMSHSNGIRTHGINLVYGYMSQEQPYIKESAPRLFKVRPGTYYLTGANTQQLQYKRERIVDLNNSYLHFKWSKKSCFQGWPDDWRDIPHFQRIAKRAEKGEKYKGPIPTPLRGYWK